MLLSKVTVGSAVADFGVTVFIVGATLGAEKSNFTLGYVPVEPLAACGALPEASCEELVGYKLNGAVTFLAIASAFD